MLHHVKGIVLRTTKYTDNSVIVNVYTNLFGLQAYMVRGVHSRTSKVKVNYFQPLAVLDMVVTKSSKHKLERINEVTSGKTTTSNFDFVKNSIALFLNELLYKTLKEEEKNPGLFEFLISAFEILGLKETGAANFHLTFMLKYSQYLGFYPTTNYSATNKVFDLAEGRFLCEPPTHHIYYLNEPLAKHINNLMNTKFETCEQLAITNVERKQLITALLNYYKLHHVLSTDLVSQTVLEQL